MLGWAAEGDGIRPEQLAATRALLQFCDAHGVVVDAIRECAAALQRADVRAALAARDRVHLGGNGAFNDVLVIPLPGEDGTYARVVFTALTAYWATMMALSDRR